MNITTTDNPGSSRSSSPTPSDSSVKFVVATLPSTSTPCPLPTCTSPSTQDVQEPMTYDQIRKARAKKRAARRHARHRARLEARFGRAGLANYDENRLMRLEVKKAGRAVLKETCTKRELSRDKRAIAMPETFETLDVVAACGMKHNQVTFEHGRIIQRSQINAEGSVFNGLVTIDDRLSAMRQALSEHTKDGSRRKEPGRQSFHVDAAVSTHSDAGIGVVYQMHRQFWPSPWTARSYRLARVKDQDDAESWAIWQALQLTLDDVNAGLVHAKSRDPCSLVVIYSDSQFAPYAISTGQLKERLVYKKIIAQSVQL